MADRKKIELKFRTEGESKAYMEGYSSAVNTFCWWLKNHPVDEAINSMILVADTLTHTFVMKDNTKERPHGEWIPCSERLPEDPDTKHIFVSKTYQVTNGYGKAMVLLWCKTEVRGKMVMRWEYHNGAIYRGDVLAWKPLSEPYKREGDLNG